MFHLRLLFWSYTLFSLTSFMVFCINIVRLNLLSSSHAHSNFGSHSCSCFYSLVSAFGKTIKEAFPDHISKPSRTKKYLSKLFWIYFCFLLSIFKFVLLIKLASKSCLIRQAYESLTFSSFLVSRQLHNSTTLRTFIHYLSVVTVLDRDWILVFFLSSYMFKT